MYGTFRRQVTPRCNRSSSLRPRKPQAISKSAEIVADARAPPRNGVTSTPSKWRAANEAPGVKFFLSRKMGVRIAFLIPLLIDHVFLGHISFRFGLIG